MEQSINSFLFSMYILSQHSLSSPKHSFNTLTLTTLPHLWFTTMVRKQPSNSFLTILPLVAVIVAILAPTGLVKTVGLQTVSGPGLLPPSWSDEDIADCWISVMKTNGCITQIYEALYKDQFSSIGPDCCKVIHQIKHTCWSRMFPFNPRFPQMIRDYCANYFAKREIMP